MAATVLGRKPSPGIESSRAGCGGRLGKKARRGGSRPGVSFRSPLGFCLLLYAWCIGQCMGLILSFFPRPYPLGGRIDVANDRLPALGDVDVLDRHLLLALRAIFLQRRHLPRLSAGRGLFEAVPWS
jgi:hypothetical protein